ncbi:uncharacterized protein LOC132813692 [Hemiscyllium ocellatum]|uniref:uncharacterized protein LOC132813692 n=1 Tax=Hemiscyllium ocellatum TaxID=170820 RepID=UPI00296698D6|nr:uncharacterized protein LOC132813692 [Hemiscyllium ocellatum]
MCLTVRTLSSRIRRNGTPGVRMWWRDSIVTQTLETRTASVTSQNQGAFPSQYRALLATNGHKPIKGESDGEPDRAVSGCIKQDGVDITHGDGVHQEIKLFPINNGNVSQDQVEDNDQEIRRCHGPQKQDKGFYSRKTVKNVKRLQSHNSIPQKQQLSTDLLEPVTVEQEEDIYFHTTSIRDTGTGGSDSTCSRLGHRNRRQSFNCS